MFNKILQILKTLYKKLFVDRLQVFAFFFNLAMMIFILDCVIITTVSWFVYHDFFIFQTMLLLSSIIMFATYTILSRSLNYPTLDTKMIYFILFLLMLLFILHIISTPHLTEQQKNAILNKVINKDIILN